MTPSSKDSPADPRARAEQLRETIAARVARLRRDAVQLAGGRSDGAASSRRLPPWALAAAAGTVAGLVAGLRRRRNP